LVFKKLGNILYNIYGTSETGLLTISTPKDLKYNNLTIGKKISGTKIKIVDSNKNKLKNGQIGQLQIKTTWSMIGESNWIKTGDLGYRDNNGYYFLSGRADDMIISAGENVYPIELESILIKHPYLEDVVVFGINDEAFGQRLKAYVQLSNGKNLSFDELIKWLKPKVARYHIPKEIEFVNEIPYNALGKLNKNKLLRNI
ncbi:MAG: fatty acid--CoA ligase family protein, partial [Clostridiales bacterium]